MAGVQVAGGPQLGCRPFTVSPLLAAPLRWPFHLQEGKVGLIENKFCNILYGQRLDKGEAPPVHDEMLCAGDFSTGTAICRVSEPFLFSPCLLSGPQFPQWWGLYHLCSLCGDPWASPCLPLCVSIP